MAIRTRVAPRLALRLALLPALLLALLLALAGPVPAPAQRREHNPREPVAALDFTGKTLAGQTLRLSELRGKVVLLNFWATWCTPCLLEMPAMDRLNRQLAGRPFVLLAINQAEERGQVERFAREHRFSFEWVLDPVGEIGSSYGANRLPMS